MSTRLRNQEVTNKPRVIIHGDSFKVEWFGRNIQEHCAIGMPTFESAIKFANKVARNYKDPS
jgi:hypothetical protein